MIFTALLACLFLILFSAFFSSVEIALASLNRMRLEKLAEEGSSTARMAVRLENRWDTALSTILIGNNIANTVLSAVVTALILGFGMSEGAAGVLSTAVVTVVLLIFGEIVPKMIGKRLSLQLARAFSYPLAIIMILLRPVTVVVVAFVDLVARIWRRRKKPQPAVTEEELSTIIETVEEEGVIDEDKGDLLQSALDFSDRTVEDILTPRVDIEAISLDKTVEEIMPMLISSHHSRFPVYRDSVDHIVGILYLTPFLKEVATRGMENVRLEDGVIETAYVHKTTKLPDALQKMREMKVHMLVVLDEYGGTLGIVTMEDILEDIVGDIWDEDDVIEDEIVQKSENTYEVLGQTNIEDLFDEIDFVDRDFESEYSTVGGWAIEMLNEDAHEGDSFRYKNLTVIVSAMGDNIIERLTVIVSPPSEDLDG